MSDLIFIFSCDSCEWKSDAEETNDAYLKCPSCEGVVSSTWYDEESYELAKRNGFI